jgi:tripartite-type tricarboxylate transporter receptor subunit TctC
VSRYRDAQVGGCVEAVVERCADGGTLVRSTEALLPFPGGQVPAFSSPIGDYLPHVKSGKLRLLATLGATRSRFTPDTAEAFAQFGIESGANTPTDMVKAVREENAAWAPIVKRVGFTPEA